MLNSLAQLLALPATMEKVYLQTLQNSVYLRVMSGTTQDRYEEMILEARSIPGQGGTSEEARLWIPQFRRQFAALVLCDETGALLCTTPEDIAALGDLDTPVLDEIVTHGKRINKIGLAEGVLDETEKNLNGVLSAASGSN